MATLQNVFPSIADATFIWNPLRQALSSPSGGSQEIKAEVGDTSVLMRAKGGNGRVKTMSLIACLLNIITTASTSLLNFFRNFHKEACKKKLAFFHFTFFPGKKIYFFQFLFFNTINIFTHILGMYYFFLPVKNGLNGC